MAPLVACAVFAALYAVGSRRRRLALGRAPRFELRRAAAFAAAMLLAAAVLSPPFDRLADESLGMHMLQHVVLMAFVPPLVVLSAPWLTVWRAFPLGLRRALAESLVSLPWRRLVSPWPAWLLVNVDIAIWHVPRIYDTTLSIGAVHDLEHVTFLVFGIVFWIPVVDSPPLHARLDDLRSALYVVGGAATGWILALVLAFAPRPLYPAYAALPHRLGGISAVGDQQIAAGVMLGIGSIPFTIAMFVYLYRWLDDGRRSEAVPQSAARLDRSSQTDARAKPARREIGTASGA